MSAGPSDQDGQMPDGQQMLDHEEEIRQQQEEDVVYADHPSIPGKVLHQDYAGMSTHMIEVIPADDLMAEAVEEVGELEEGREYLYEYDSMVHTQHDQNIIYQLYQPLETANGMFVCRICLELGETVEFDNKASYTHHRYKVHGSYNNNHVCPVLHCREIYASMTILRKHLIVDHKMPIEMHHRVFPTIGEFERFRHLVESICQCRFMMHTKQPHNRRQIMHCSRSEHKQILQSRRHRLPQVRMMKEGAWCPAQISFKIDPNTGRVDAFYQLFHYGHAKEYRDEEMDNSDLILPSGPMDIVFPELPHRPADRPMQYVQIDLIPADSCVYVNTVYSHVLIMTDVKTRYMFAKPIPEVGMRQLLIRILTDIFLQFGVSEGFSCSHSVTLIRDVMNTIAGIFRVTLKEIIYDRCISSCLSYDYEAFLRTLYEQAAFELQSKHRWVEMVQFTTMVLNQLGRKSPFERMFNRKPYNLPDQKVAPWLVGEELSLGDDEAHIDVEFDEQVEQQDENAESNEDQLRTAPHQFQNGEKVYLRNFDIVPGRGNTLPYLYGYIGAIDFENSPHFPYRVHFSKSKDPWPNESSVSAWVNPYDILPITHELLLIPDEERVRASTSLLCSCGGGQFGTPCPLFRSYLCANGMAKACCLNSGKTCEYHEECADGDDTYYRMESLSKSFTENQPRSRTRRRIPHLTPANAPLLGEQDEMPVLTSEGATPKGKRKRNEQDLICSLPVVSTIVVESDDRTLVPAISKRTVIGDVHKKELPDENFRESQGSAERCAPSSDRTLPAKKGRRDQVQEASVEQQLSVDEKPLTSEARPVDDSKPRARRSVRNCKTKVYEDYVPIT
ncbi:zinc finger, C2H2 type [Ancylostoma caninum]|uniref:Zinc finger, C2H2 type n=1 Tax=Ancylostoma caninum TaxID=29170 RepID=A0A368GB42_ANCCA|nr:zinc finger, C2H2 type [Ancylostoma caninum]